MKNVLIGILLALLVVFGILYFTKSNDNEGQLIESTALIQKELQNVGKLIVTEGTFSQVFTYKNSKKFYLDVFSARKKAIVIVNAKVTVAYDLRQIKTDLDEENRVLRITHIPKEEISINPSIEYYDVTQDYLNQFNEEDYNKIKSKVEAVIREKIEQSNLRSNAQNRLISELHRLYVLTNTLGWTLEYNGIPIETENEIQQLKL